MGTACLYSRFGKKSDETDSLTPVLLIQVHGVTLLLYVLSISGYPGFRCREIKARPGRLFVLLLKSTLFWSHILRIVL